MWRLTNENGQVSYLAVTEDQQISLGIDMNYEQHEVILDKPEEFKLLLRRITE
jgi:hypothetical protein